MPASASCNRHLGFFNNPSFQPCSITAGRPQVTRHLLDGFDRPVSKLAETGTAILAHRRL